MGEAHPTESVILRLINRGGTLNIGLGRPTGPDGPSERSHQLEHPIASLLDNAQMDELSRRDRDLADRYSALLDYDDATGLNLGEAGRGVAFLSPDQRQGAYLWCN